ncbi:MAG: hypothetical protein PVI73_11810, partial [Syntrophobacterales bacterium]
RAQELPALFILHVEVSQKNEKFISSHLCNSKIIENTLQEPSTLAEEVDPLRRVVNTYCASSLY